MESPTYNQILELYTNEDDELEIRFGYYTHRGFRAGITQFSYHYFLNYFTTEFPTLEKTTNVCTLKRYPNGLRSIDHEGGSATVSKKERKGIMDLREDSMRVAISREYHDIEDLPVDPAEYTMKFKRIRTTFFDKEGGFRIDISHNMSCGKISKNASPYELEIEFIRKPTIDNFKRVVQWSSDIYSYMKKYYQSVIYRFNSFFRNEVKIRHELYRDSSKPVNIKKHNIPYLSNYVFSAKPNGIGYFLFFDKFGVYYLNETTVKRVHNPIRELYGTIILGEHMPNGFGKGKFKNKDIYLGYDMLFFKNTDVRGQYAVNRNKQLYVIMNHLPNFTVLPMFFSGELPTQAIQATFKFIHEHFNGEENDGIVMKHNYSHFDFKYDQNSFKYPVWKWKPSEHITIDFSVSCDSNYKDKEVCGKYMLFTGVKGGEISIFKGTMAYPYDGYVDIGIDKFGLIHAGTIIEFGWDYGLKKLYPTRIRDDKVKPNFHITAESTWEDIFNPISENCLIELSEYSINRKDDESIIANKICKFIKKTNDASVLYTLNDYLSSKTISDTFILGLEIADRFNIDNSIVKSLRKIYNN